MSTANRVIKNTMYLYARMAVSIVFSFFTTRILLQSLGASDYGLYNVVAGALSLLGFLSASLSSATQRFISYAEGEGNYGKIKEIFNNAVFLHRWMAIVICLFFIIAGFVFFNGVLNIPDGREWIAIAVYGCMIFSTVFAIIIVPYDAVLNAHENMKYYSILGIGDVLVKFAIALLVMYCKSLDQLLLYGMLMAIESWLYQFTTRLYCSHNYSEVQEISRKNYVNKATLRSMTSFAGWNMLNISAGMISLYGIGIVLNHYYGTKLNAAWGIALQVQGVLMGISSNMVKALNPVVVKSEGAGDRVKMIDLSLTGCKMSFLLYSFFALPIMFTLQTLLKLWLKDVPDYTFIFCCIMLISCMVEQLYFVLTQAISAEGNIRDYNIYKSATTILTLVMSIVMFELGGKPYWIALNWLIYNIGFGYLIALYYSKKNLGLEIIEYCKKVLFRSVAIIVLQVILFMILSRLFNSSTYSQLAFLFLLFICNAPIFYYVGLNTIEKEKVRNEIIRKCILHRH